MADEEMREERLQTTDQRQKSVGSKWEMESLSKGGMENRRKGEEVGGQKSKNRCQRSEVRVQRNTKD
jgi:hypothetical protein